MILACIYYFQMPKQVSKPLNRVSFESLDNWQQSRLNSSLKAFKKSCQSFLKRPAERFVGSTMIPMTVNDWLPSCQKALSMDSNDNEATHQFFEDYFDVYQVGDNKTKDGLFTGYYSPVIKGSLEKTKTYNVPLYQKPKNLVLADLSEFSKSLPNKHIVGRLVGNQFKPFYTRAEIDNGAIDKAASVLAWIKSDIDRSFLQIQGSGIILLEDGTKLYAGYDGQNGKAYTALAKVLIDKGAMTRDSASMQKIRAYLEKNPQEKPAVLHSNESFVFFKKQQQTGAIGSQGVVLTDEVSLAVDTNFVPLGVPLWLETSAPAAGNYKSQQPFHQLMVAQDTGGAIKGLVRGDIYWGSSEKAASTAGKMKNTGQYYLFLPKSVKI